MFFQIFFVLILAGDCKVGKRVRLILLADIFDSYLIADDLLKLITDGSSPVPVSIIVRLSQRERDSNHFHRDLKILAPI